MAGPFDVSVSVDGELVRFALADLSVDLLRRCRPVRRPGTYRRQRHMPGRWFASTAGRFLEYESLLERDWMLLLDFDREVRHASQASRSAATTPTSPVPRSRPSTT